jgi:hypothetical protein
VETNAANVVNMCNTRHRIPVRSPENSAKYFALLIPSFQIIFKLNQSLFQRFVGGANSPDSKSLTVWYALSHMRRMTAARQKVLIGVGRFGVTKITISLQKDYNYN